MPLAGRSFSSSSVAYRYFGISTALTSLRHVRPPTRPSHTIANISTFKDINLPIFALLYVGWKIFKKTKIVRLFFGTPGLDPERSHETADLIIAAGFRHRESSIILCSIVVRQPELCREFHRWRRLKRLTSSKNPRAYQNFDNFCNVSPVKRQ
jgi:hypothetical protein